MLKTFGVAAAFAFASTAALAASPAEGLWQTETNGGQVQIYECGPALCGKLVTSNGIKADPGMKDTKNKDASLRGRPLKDLLMLQGFTGGPAEWKGGSVYKADDGRTYKGSMKLLNPNQLKLTGCIIAPLCKTQTWTRIR
jgi:uncharacterized protein (DUF2147 family)